MDYIYDGFAAQKRTSSEPISLDNTGGKIATQCLLNIAKVIIMKHDKKWVGRYLFNAIIGQGMHAPGVYLNIYTLPKDVSNRFKNEDLSWPPGSDHGVRETRIPDVTTIFSPRKKDKKRVIIADVKSSEDIGSSLDDHVKLFHEAWKKALFGITNSDYTYGLLVHPEGAKLFCLKLVKKHLGDKTKQYLYTYTEDFNFKALYENSQVDILKFNVDQLLLLLKRIIAIFLQVYFP